MATKPVTYCDVYGTIMDVKKYELTLTELDKDGSPRNVTAARLGIADLCPKAVKRLVGFVKKGLNPPNPGKYKGVSQRIPPAKKPDEQDAPEAAPPCVGGVITAARV